MRKLIPNGANDEEGIALLIAVLLLLMVSALGLTALQSAQNEATGSGRARAKVSTLYAATAALEIVQQQLDQTGTQYPTPVPFDIPNFMTDQWGFPTAVRTGTANTVGAQPIESLGSGPPANSQLNIGAANTFSIAIYRANVVATAHPSANPAIPAEGLVELQAQYAISQGAQGYK